MNEKADSTDTQDAKSPAAAGSRFASVFGVGLLGWLLGVVVLLGIGWTQAEPQNPSSAVLWAMSNGWAAALFGLLALVVYGLVKHLPVRLAALAYALPVALFALLSALCLVIYPDSFLREELLTYLPVVFVFYLLGFLWVRMGRKTADTPVMVRAVFPALVGGLVILGMVVVPVFASDAFRYRGAFLLTVDDTSVKDNVLSINGTIKILKPGNYRFSAPRYAWIDAGESDSAPEVELGKFQWGESGAPEKGATGVFPVQISWSRGIPAQATPEAMFFDEWVNIEVRDADKNERMIFSMNAPLATE